MVQNWARSWWYVRFWFAVCCKSSHPTRACDTRGVIEPRRGVHVPVRRYLCAHRLALLACQDIVPAPTHGQTGRSCSLCRHIVSYIEISWYIVAHRHDSDIVAQTSPSWGKPGAGRTGHTRANRTNRPQVVNWPLGGRE